jgi:hypothetical protein
MSATFKSSAVGLLMLPLALSCGGADSVGDVQGGVVKGQVVDSRGAPLGGADVTVCSTVFYDSCVGGKSGSDGRYSFELPGTDVWSATASITRTFDGQTFCLDLEPSSTDSFSSDKGAIRNFAWKISGMRPDKTAANEFLSYYGAGLEIDSADYNYSLDLRYVQVHLVPQGSLVDGSSGVAIDDSPGAWNWNTIGNVPLGRYAVTATYSSPAGRAALLVSTSSNGPFASAATVDFAPSDGGTCLTPEAKVWIVVAP